ncbi:DUF397 domain-containing protein [Streptomyces sp. NPDC001480]|uniref:DUF397 domain-containing protein n=1 Tax=Streptomyces sp. NPDC001480 TaxID=3364577 RepID=UPI0036909D44
MTTRAQWQKSAFSGGGEGNDCVEIAHLPTHIAIRDSKAPALATLSLPERGLHHLHNRPEIPTHYPGVTSRAS